MNRILSPSIAELFIRDPDPVERISIVQHRSERIQQDIKDHGDGQFARKLLELYQNLIEAEGKATKTTEEMKAKQNRGTAQRESTRQELEKKSEGSNRKEDEIKKREQGEEEDLVKVVSSFLGQVLQRYPDSRGQLDIFTHQLRAPERHSIYCGSSMYLDHLIKSYRDIVKKIKEGLAK